MTAPPTKDCTLTAIFAERACTDGDRVALHYCRQGEWQTDTWADLLRQAATVAQRLVDAGVAPGDRVVQVSENRREWIVTDLAVLLARAVHVPLHATLAAAQIAQQVGDCGAKVVIVSAQEQLDKLSECRTGLAQVFSYDAESPLLEGELLSAEEAVAMADAAVAATRADDLATILYTSGTTGEPKGVMLSHGNLVSNIDASLAAFNIQAEDIRISFLPFSHVFARTCDMYAWIAAGHELALAESREKILENCRQTQPTLINGVPYFFEKVVRHLLDNDLVGTPGALSQMFGGRLRACVSGGAALPDYVAEVFERQEVRLVEGYGLTETSPVICTGTPSAHRRGTVGLPLGGIDVRIAEDGEILTRGPHVMQGYWNRPDATAEAIRDGWFYTGDFGELDDDGFLRITGRKKEMIVLASGKNVAPVQLESLLTADPLISQAVVVGDGKNYLTALVVPERDPLRAWIFANKIAVMSREQALAHPKVLAMYRERIDTRLADVGQHEQIGGFHVMGRGFTVESGELTPTLKLRRETILANMAVEVATLYETTTV